jgi:uncharacterized protein (TIGR04206 family)
MNAKRRLLGILVLGIIPWSVIMTGGFVMLVFPFGFLNVDPWHLLTLPEYLRFSAQTTQYIGAWPIGALLYAVTLLSAVGGVFGYEDRRLTGGFLVSTALSQIPFVLGFAQRLKYSAYPVGIVLMFVVAWWFYWPVTRRSKKQ